MRFKHALAFSLSAVLLAGAWWPAVAGDPTAVIPKTALQWKDLGNGIQAAPVSGVMEK